MYCFTYALIFSFSYLSELLFQGRSSKSPRPSPTKAESPFCGFTPPLPSSLPCSEPATARLNSNCDNVTNSLITTNNSSDSPSTSTVSAGSSNTTTTAQVITSHGYLGATAATSRSSTHCTTTADSGINKSSSTLGGLGGLGGGLTCGTGETSLSEWSEDEDGGASEPLLDHDQDSTGYATDDPGLDHASMMNDTGLTDAEGIVSRMLTAVFIYIFFVKWRFHCG